MFVNSFVGKFLSRKHFLRASPDVKVNLQLWYQLWQNRSNYSGSSALLIAVQLQSAQRTSNGTILWSVGSPPDATTVQQDRSRFTSHEGEFTSQNSSSTFNLQPYIHYYKPSSKISKFYTNHVQTDKHNSLSKLTTEEKVLRDYTRREDGHQA
jgi:hypothetical protein